MNERRKTDNSGGLSVSLPNVHNAPVRQSDPVACLREPSIGSTIHRLRKKDALFYQAMPADCVFYVLKGRVKLTTVSTEGKEATVALMRTGDFLGEECVAEGRPLRTTTAIAISDCTVLRIERKAMVEVLRRNSDFFNFFLSYIVLRNVRMQEDLVDHLFHTSEKRLARVLLVLAGLEDASPAEIMVPKISQETLAEIVGTTRSRISFFMNGFRKQGFIDYDGDYSGNILIRSSLRSILSGGK